ncbi:hypothetical protein IFM89_016485 [Coptis chinensis]|uniref:DNA polymerase zeta catalytic subunit n=1 Tax=Coptis chinensis TaxID=261450 RepID=A0A835LRZ8_9MAGN|nr:hypothetical protein IFM89_016485 [Coptis chinensis]
MENISQPDHNTLFSVRIVSIDYYMSPPITDLDISYSTFQGVKVNEVPVIRIYGSTPAGQKTCLHIHRALPYLYVPCSSSIQSSEQGENYKRDIANAIEKALKVKIKSSSGLKRQHVHGCSLVRAKKFYGYYKPEELFVKIYLYYPHEVARVATLLLDGAILGRSYQPHESHIPYLLQFLVEYNLYGMGHLHVSKVKFRYPLPDGFIPRGAQQSGMYRLATGKADSGHGSCLGMPIWTSSTVLTGWIWPHSTETDSSPDQELCLIKRQSICELEGDATVDDILNQQFKMYSPLSQTCSDVKMVQSLVPMWQEEYERTGVHEEVIHSDPSKPLPENVLKTLSHGPEFEDALLYICSKAEKSSSSQGPLSEDAERFLHSIRSLVDVGSLREFSEHANPICSHGDSFQRSEEVSRSGSTSSCSLSKHDDDAESSEARHKLLEIVPADETFNMIGSSDPKGIDTEALGLLRWLASSQAAEDLNTDDELGYDMILTPLLPKTAIGKILDKANLDYECESQQECQDILDSVLDPNSCLLKEQALHSTSGNHLTDMPVGNIIPQVDGSSDDLVTGSVSTSKKDRDGEMGRSSSRVIQGTNICCSSGKKKRGRLWGTLPFSMLQKASDSSEASSFNSTDVSNEMKDCTTSISSGKEDDEGCEASVTDAKANDHGLKKQKEVAESSTRDLMRRKRYRRVEASEGGTCRVTNISTGKEEEKTSLSPKRLEFHMKNKIPNRMCAKSVEMSFSKKPPLYNWKNWTSEDTAVAPVVHDQKFIVDMEDCEGILGWIFNLLDIEGGVADDVFPFFSDNVGDVEELNDRNNEVIKSSGEAVVGIPTHYQNDGSLLYLLTTVYSPPSVDSISEWLLHHPPKHDATGTRKNISSKVLESPSPGGNNRLDFSKENDSFNDGKTASEPPKLQSVLADDLELIYSQEHLVNSFHEFSDKFGHVPHMESSSDQLIQKDNRNSMKVNNLSEVMTERHSEGTPMKGNEHIDSCQDISQISGPDMRSKLTPLSQTGFRDPASVGAGQQLTLMSIEVQAESRGDLRPDPRNDAVTVIAVRIQDDNDLGLETFVLLRGNEGESFQRNLDAISGCTVIVVLEEKHLFYHFVKIVRSSDPDILMGWEIQGGSLGFLAERAAHLGILLLSTISRTPSCETEARNSATGEIRVQDDLLPEALVTDPTVFGNTIIEDEWGRTHASGVHVGGRIVLNIWRLMRGEVKLNMYTMEAVAEEVLRRKVPLIPPRILAQWFSSGPGRARFRCIEYIIERTKLNLEIMDQLDMINRTSELARVFGIDFFSVLSRGSQYRVESMFLRLAHTQNYLAISPGNQQVASQPAMECLPLVMEPESCFYADPVVVLDFQSLYPSMIIAYNLCFCTCLGKVIPAKEDILGVCSYIPDPQHLMDIKNRILLTPNGVMYVPSEVRKGVLPRLLEEILSTRIMVKRAMKSLTPSERVSYRIFNARQLALKLISNVTYGYTAAGFSGRMPCAELADSIVQCGRRTLENAISYVNSHDKWKARVIYGDTDR